MTTSARCRFLILRHSLVRVPGRYVVPEALRHHALELPLDGRRQQLVPTADAMCRHRPVLARLDELAEQPPPLLVRQADHVVALDRQHVEDEQRGLPLVALDQLEARPACVVEHDELGVEDRPLGGHRIGQPAQLRVLGRDVVEVGALQPHRALLDEGQRAVPVPLDLERPAGIVVGHRAQRRPHRRRRGTSASASRQPARQHAVGFERRRWSRRRSRGPRRARRGCPRLDSAGSPRTPTSASLKCHGEFGMRIVPPARSGTATTAPRAAAHSLSASSRALRTRPDASR